MTPSRRVPLPFEGALSGQQIEAAVKEAGLSLLPVGVAEKFAVYAELLQRWNLKLNLTALRSSRQILDRHFIECIFCAQHISPQVADSIDFGSGAGFPGIPIALCRPEIKVTLAESNFRKAAFLREVVRTLDLNTSVYAGRVENMPADRLFDQVTMRAVDKIAEAIPLAAERLKTGGRLVILTTSVRAPNPPGFTIEATSPLPTSRTGILLQLLKI